MASGIRRAPSMHDVAALAGVSHQTVSRVLNDPGTVRPSTRDRVQDAIRELGYHRNLSARALVTRRSRAIGVLAHAATHYGPTRTVQAIEQSAREAGYHPLVTPTTPDRESVIDNLAFLVERSVEALAVIAPDERVLAAVREFAARVPIVTLQTTGLAIGIPVSVDQVGGARLATEHLLGLGHVRIQHLAGPAESLEASARAETFHAVLAAAGLDPLADVAGDWTADSGYAAAGRIARDTTAVFAANDQMALGLVHGLAERGRRVPEDVSIVGFDDFPEAAHFWPPLTTVHQDFAEVGRVAVAAMLSGIETGTPPDTPLVPARFVLRSSTSAPTR